MPDFFSNDLRAAQLPNSDADRPHESTSMLMRADREDEPAAGTVHCVRSSCSVYWGFLCGERVAKVSQLLLLLLFRLS